MDKNKKKEIISAEKVLISVGRKPYTEGLNLNKLGIKKEFMLQSRLPSAAPAVGLNKLHIEQQKKLINETLNRD